MILNMVDHYTKQIHLFPVMSSIINLILKYKFNFVTTFSFLVSIFF